MSDETSTVIFSDGACSGNPGPGGYGVIVAYPDGRVVERGAAHSQTTNNRMELSGSIAGLVEARKEKDAIILCTDSTYVIRGITQWIFGWRQRGWKTAGGDDVSNKDLWLELSSLIDERKRSGFSPVDWRYVRGHVGNPGNERVDEIAVSFSQGRPAKLFQGRITDYGVDLSEIPAKAPLPEMKPKGETKKAFSYLSYVDGRAERHASWPECERRVKGRSGAKFKKAMSSAEEEEILASWGADLP